MGMILLQKRKERSQKLNNLLFPSISSVMCKETPSIVLSVDVNSFLLMKETSTPRRIPASSLIAVPDVTIHLRKLYTSGCMKVDVYPTDQPLGADFNVKKMILS